MSDRVRSLVWRRIAVSVVEWPLAVERRGVSCGVTACPTWPRLPSDVRLAAFPDQHKKALGSAAADTAANNTDADQILQEGRGPLLWRIAGWFAALLWLAWTFNVMFDVSLVPIDSSADPKDANQGSVWLGTRSVWDFLEHALDIQLKFGCGLALCLARVPPLSSKLSTVMC